MVSRFFVMSATVNFGLYWTLFRGKKVALRGTFRGTEKGALLIAGALLHHNANQPRQRKDLRYDYRRKRPVIGRPDH